ncbi:uncharacterized protein LOC141719665 [Apium graveolens]|uniref:uncharacterized protein LOC141719665 n=1 Tax=Apium graveolens TaxID=4045 RepID=UPI003D7BF1D7
MDFIIGLPNSLGYSVIFVVVDRLSKFAHFMPLKHPFDVVQVAQVYLDNVFKLHGWPKSIVSDIDSIFLSKIWQALFTIYGTIFRMSIIYHPATDGQTEVVNRCLEVYLRSHITPYEVVYNQPPPLHLPYLPGETDNHEVDISMLRREQMISTLKFFLKRAQNRMKVQADKHRIEREVKDWEGCLLKLSSEVKIHDVVHISQLKAFHGPSPLVSTIPNWVQQDNQSKPVEIEAILDHRMVKVQNKAQVQYLVKWKNTSEADNFWVNAELIADRFPAVVQSYFQT